MNNRNGKFGDLKKQSRETLHDLLLWWIGGSGADGRPNTFNALKPTFLKKSLDECVGTSLISREPSHFITYAIQIDDMNLFDDLIAKGAKINIVDRSLGSITPLQYACELGRADMVEKLLKHGANSTNIKVKYKMDPCEQPATCLWGFFQQNVYGYRVDYDKTREVIKASQRKLR